MFSTWFFLATSELYIKISTRAITIMMIRDVGICESFCFIDIAVYQKKVEILVLLMYDIAEIVI